MIFKRIFKILAVITLILAMGYSIYSSGVGEWMKTNWAKDEQKADGRDSENPGEGQKQAEASQPDDVLQDMTVEGVNRVVDRGGSGKSETRISGDKIVVRKDKLYRILSPVVVTMARERADKQDVDVKVGNVRLTAEHALFNEKTSRLDLENSVRAVGDDFVITTESVTYEASDQKVRGEKPVRVERYKVDDQGKKKLAMVITGRGLRGDLVVSSVQLQEDVKAVLYDVSREFMASGRGESDAGSKSDASRNIVIRSEGPMIYQDGAREVTFKQNVRLTSEGKKLRAEKVVIKLAEKDDGETQVSGLTAHDRVELSFEEKKATGKTLVWKNITQAGVLHGSPAQLDTPELSVRGEELTFVRLDNRFQVKGPGTLTRKPVTGEEREKPKETNDMQFSADSPIHVHWKGGMTYDAQSQKAEFRRDVKVTQDTIEMRCDNMDMHFTDSRGDVEKLISTGSVEITDGEGDKKRTAKCHKALWEGGSRVVTLKAKEGQQVVVELSQEKLMAPVVSYLPGSNRLECSESGRLILKRAMTDGNDKDNSMEVTWKSFMLYEKSTGAQAVFQGDVHVQQTDRDLRSQFLRVMFDEDQNAERVIASGDAVLDVQGAPDLEKDGEGKDDDKTGKDDGQKIEKWSLSSDRIEGYLKENRVKASGEGRLDIERKQKGNDWIQWDDRMRANFQDSDAEFFGNVRSNFAGARLNSESLRLDFNENRELRHLSAKKNVHFESSGEQNWTMDAEFAEAIFAPGSVLSQIIARDNVRVRDDVRQLESNFFILFFQKKENGEGQVLDRAVARKDVRVKYTGDEKLWANCERLDWNAESDEYRLQGTPASLKKSNMQVDGEKIIIDRASGRVSLPGGDTPASTTMEE